MDEVDRVHHPRGCHVWLGRIKNHRPVSRDGKPVEIEGWPQCGEDACLNPDHRGPEPRPSSRPAGWGRAHPLTAEELSTVLAMAKQGVTKAAIARAFGLDWQTIHKLVARSNRP